jgi:hypothetical protein
MYWYRGCKEVGEHDGIRRPRNNSHPGGSMRCGIVKLHYRFSRVRISPAVQDISERLKCVLAEAGAVKLCLRWEPIDQDGAADAQEHGGHSFADADRGAHSCGDFIGWQAPDPLMFIVLSKSWLIPSHNIAEIDASLAFKELK